MAAGARVALVAVAMTAVGLAAAVNGVAAAPPGFPAPLVPADNPMSPARVALGEQLFGDRRLSVTGEYACVSCHDPVRAFSDAQPRAVGAQGDKLRRNSPSILYSAWNPSLGWDPPGSPTLEKQMLTPLFGKHPVELGLARIESRVLAQLQADGALRSRFEEAFPGERQPLTMDNVVRAIATYERSLGEGSSAFDRYVFDADRGGMSPSALRGLELFFNSRPGCVDCHSGMAFSGSLRSVAQPDEAPRFADNGQDTEGPARVPSLRNVAVTAPYMRDGSLPTLAAVIDHYDRGSPGVQPPLPALHLTREEKADLQAFLESLTDRPYEPLLSRP
ncbi:MAG: hypothetical protein RL030_1940 [Pseudomonadota bacterium]